MTRNSYLGTGSTTATHCNLQTYMYLNCLMSLGVIMTPLYNIVLT